MADAKQQPAIKQPSSGGNGLGIASLILGILSIPFAFFISPLGIILGILALIFGIIQRKKSPNGVATTGLVLGIIGALLSIVVIIIAVLLVATMFSSIAGSLPKA